MTEIISVTSYTVSEMRYNQELQEKLLTERQSLLNELKDAIADQRKTVHLFEHERQMNIILKTTLEEMLNKVMFICNTNSNIR